MEDKVGKQQKPCMPAFDPTRAAKPLLSCIKPICLEPHRACAAPAAPDYHGRFAAMRGLFPDAPAYRSALPTPTHPEIAA